MVPPSSLALTKTPSSGPSTSDFTTPDRATFRKFCDAGSPPPTTASRMAEKRGVLRIHDPFKERTFLGLPTASKRVQILDKLKIMTRQRIAVVLFHSLFQ